MRKILLTVILLGGVFSSSGCQLATSVGGSLVEGAADKVGEFAEAKNRDTLLQAVEAGAAVGIAAADIDKNSDGMMDQDEALSFGVAYAKAKGGEVGEAVIEKLKTGDIAGVRQELEAAKNSGVDWVGMLLGLLGTALATWKAVNVTRDWNAPKRYKNAVEKS